MIKQLELMIENENEALQEWVMVSNNNQILDIDLHMRYQDLVRRHMDMMDMISNMLSSKAAIEQQNYNLLKRNKELVNICSFDTLTGGVHSRKFLLEAIGMALKNTLSNKSEMVIAILDIDNFKHVNDTYGHQCGDMALKHIAQSINDSLRPEDMIGRYGGEEFIIVLPDTTLDIGVEVIERLRNMLENLNHSVINDELTISASFGMTAYKGEGVMTIDDVIYEADMALADAKKSWQEQS